MDYVPNTRGSLYLQLVLLVIAVALAAVTTACVASNPYATQQAAALRATAAQLRQVTPPGPYCDFGGFATTDTLIVLEVSERFRRMGIKVNDRIKSVDGSIINARSDFATMLYQRKPGDRLTLELDRSGNSVQVQLNCENGQQLIASYVAALDAGARRDWLSCVQQVGRYELTTIPTSTSRQIRMMCNEAARMERGLAPSAADAMIVFDFAKSALRDAPYTSGGVDSFTAMAIQNIDWLRNNGFASMGDELSKALTEARSSNTRTAPPQAPRPEARSQRTGSGFLVALETVVTNAHVVEACEDVSANGLPATLLRIDSSNDLAVLHVAGLASPPLNFRGGSSIRSGESVVALGFPLPDVLSSDLKVTTGSITATSGIADDIRLLQISAPVQPGSSGGPLLDEQGLVVGVVSSKLDALFVAAAIGDLPQNVNFAIKSEVVGLFLDAAGVPHTSSIERSRVGADRIASDAAASVVRIICRS